MEARPVRLPQARDDALRRLRADLILLVPLEFFSNIPVRLVTLTLRLFGNMFAGHLLLILFATGGAALLTSGNLLYGGVGILSFALGISVSFWRCW